MDLVVHQRIARFIFWFSQILGAVTIFTLMLFIGGNLVGDLVKQDFEIREDYGLFVLFICEALVALAFRISWRRRRPGSFLILATTILVCIIWGRQEINLVLFHLPVFFSGLLLVFYSYYKEWILKHKP